MAELGALSQYALSVQQMQMSVIKTQMEMQQQIVELLMESSERMVSLSATHGHNVDVSI
mgnify:FL=1